MYSGNGRKHANTIYTEAQVGNALRKSGIRIESEIHTHFIVYCEYHYNHNTPSGEVDKESGLFYCFSCKTSASLVNLVIKASGASYFEALRIIGDDECDVSKLVDELAEDKEIAPFDQSVLDRLHSSVWGVGSEYFYSRHITDESIVKFELGYSVKQSMVTVPIHSPNGVPWGFVGRSIEGKRFKNNRGLNKSLTLFNIHRVWTSSRVFVVESSFDAIRLDQVGIPAVATLGAGVSVEQLNLLRRSFDDIVLIPDGDQAGEAMTKKMLKFIPSAQILQINNAKDVGDLSDEDLTAMV